MAGQRSEHRFRPEAGGSDAEIHILAVGLDALIKSTEPEPQLHVYEQERSGEHTSLGKPIRECKQLVDRKLIEIDVRIDYQQVVALATAGPLVDGDSETDIEPVADQPDTWMKRPTWSPGPSGEALSNHRHREFPRRERCEATHLPRVARLQ